MNVDRIYPWKGQNNHSSVPIRILQKKDAFLSEIWDTITVSSLGIHTSIGSYVQRPQHNLNERSAKDEFLDKLVSSMTIPELGKFCQAKELQALTKPKVLQLHLMFAGTIFVVFLLDLLNLLT
jgi:hypothetical protein